MKFVAVIINVIVGSIFLLSAYFKMYPIEFFEAKVSMFGFGALTGALLARLVLGIELLVAICLLLQITLNRKIQKLTLVLLIGFIAINLVDLIRYGNDTNCGCMGMEVSMTPLQSIGKNILLIGLVWVSLKYSQVSVNIPNRYLRLLVILIPFAAVFMIKPVYLPADPEMPLKGSKPDFTVMDNHPGFKGKTYDTDLSKGKKIVAFLSLTCPHCKIAGFKLTSYKATNPDLPVYFIINGDSTDMNTFMKAVGGKDVEMAHFNGKDDFANLGGYNLPSILLIDNGVVQEQYDNGTLNKTVVLDWYNKK